MLIFISLGSLIVAPAFGVRIGGDISGADSVGGDITGADVISGDISRVSIGSPAGSDESWARQHGGWIRVVNSFVSSAGSTPSFCDLDCNPEGECRCLPAKTYHGIYIAKAEFDDEAVGASWTPPQKWMFSVEERPAGQLEPNSGDLWVPAGSYILIEYFFQTEVNPGYIDYMPCSHWLIRPAKAVKIAPGSIVVYDDEDLTSPDITCSTQFQPDTTLSTTETESSIRDARVYEYPYRNWDDANWGGWESLALKSEVNGIPNTRGRIFLWFDPSTISYNPGTDRVLLNLVHLPTEQSGEIKAYVYRVTEDWNEGEGTYHPGQEEADALGTISWNNQPGYDSSKIWAEQELYPSASVYTVSWDITELTDGWISGEFPNFGLVIVGEGEGVTSYSHIFASSEASDVALRPSIVVIRGS